MDPYRRVLLLNSALEALAGFRRHEVLGVPCRDVLRASVCGSNCPVLQAEQNNAPVTIEGDIINRDRQKIPVRITAAPLSDLKGRVVGFMETVADIRTPLGSVDQIPHLDSLGQLIGQSAKMRELFRLVPVVAQTDSSLLITGETGTGKDVLAEVIHEASDRADGPFIKINCGALPETLMESELFGHKKGAFTGAVNDKAGRLRLAHNGTLYLTEIGDLPLPLQVKFLTFLDDKVVYPLGSTSGFQADVRVIAATHRNLEQMVAGGLFRQDLLFRLNVVRFHLPPLRERGKDIGLLLDHFLKVYSSRFGKRIGGVSQQVRNILLNYGYPGNVRELRNIVEYATSICPLETIQTDHLPVYLLEDAREAHHEIIGPAAVAPSMHDAKGRTGRMNWADSERQLIIDTLFKVNGRRSKAAEILGWGRTTLWRKMKEYGLAS
ncbi:MAG: sigma 54-interacting transcriptional regulator [Deltaproteobacteria bacterium]|nr:sigma 54-interacting transcriptional regulator [Deltaproteobacteria bacterium]